MQEILCPRCSVVNSSSAIECRQCHYPFNNLPPSAFITDKFQLKNTAFQTTSPVSETGRKTYFWYRMYCAALFVLYATMAVLGLVAMIGSYGSNVDKPQDAFSGGAFLLFLGAVLGIIYLVGVILSPKPASWILGIVLITLGMTSVCFLPFTLPLIFFWLKPETQKFFGRQK